MSVETENTMFIEKARAPMPSGLHLAMSNNMKDSVLANLLWKAVGVEPLNSMQYPNLLLHKTQFLEDFIHSAGNLPEMNIIYVQNTLLGREGGF